jgi:hypothetical protein
MTNGKYVNGVRIGDWFFSNQENWMHFHSSAFTPRWRMCKKGVCLTCQAEVPTAVRTHAKLQKLAPKATGVLATWPVHAE